MNPIGIIVKCIALLAGFAVVLSKLAGELLVDLFNRHKSKVSPPVAAQTPAAPTGMLASSISTAPPPDTARTEGESKNSIDTAGLKTAQADNEPEHEPDELDWAGSLSHAGLTALHLDNVLSMVQNGWLMPGPDRAAAVAPALAALEAFHARTCTAIAPMLDQMTDEQRAEFFADDGPDFPPQLPMEETP